MKAQQVENRSLSSCGVVYTPQQTKTLLNSLSRDINWQTNFVAFGRRFDIPRLQAWYADDGVHYRYSDNKLHSNSWTDELLAIKQIVEDRSGYGFNSVLLTYYRDGDDHVPWHADDEQELGDAPVIASLSLGARRVFHYRHKQKAASGSIQLHDGELIVMQPAFQEYWEHSVQPEPGVVVPRINLTFRLVVSLNDASPG
jgi:alkylated DNA repair dioxygenase AlkB